MVTWTRERHFDEAWYMTSSQVETSSNSLITHQFLNNSIMAGQGGGSCTINFWLFQNCWKSFLSKNFRQKMLNLRLNPQLRKM